MSTQPPTPAEAARDGFFEPTRRPVQLLVTPRHLRGDEILLGQLAAAEVDGFEPRQPLVQRIVRQPFGIQFLRNVGVDPHLLDTLDIARARSEPEAVQDMNDRLVVGIGGDRG